MFFISSMLSTLVHGTETVPNYISGVLEISPKYYLCTLLIKVKKEIKMKRKSIIDDYKMLYRRRVDYF